MTATANIIDLSSKPSGYFTWSRPEMLEFVPNTATRILDVGCGAGLFGKSIKARQHAEVWGIEYNPTAAEQAQANLDKVLLDDVYEVIPALPDNYFDCIVFNDVLEHLTDPYMVLQLVKKNLTDNGVVACSIPNVRHYQTLFKLVFRKEWKYEDAGVLDKTHLRFFTKKSMRDMFSALDYEILKLKGLDRATSKIARAASVATLGWLSDTLYSQYGCQVRPRR